MSDTANIETADRVFKLWEYQVSHGQLLIRSPKAPASNGLPEQRTNVDLVFLGVEYLAVPSLLKGIKLADGTPQEVHDLAETLGRPTESKLVRILVSRGKRFPVVAAHMALSENDWDIFDSPFEFRSHFRGSGT